jgi:hypothetical protein
MEETHRKGKTQMPDVQFQIQVPDDMQGGAYANLVSVWQSPYDFTLDFLSTLQPGLDEAGNTVVPARVVSRVKLPPAQIFEVMKALNAELAKYEANFGAIQAPGAAKKPPDGDVA